MGIGVAWNANDQVRVIFHYTGCTKLEFAIARRVLKLLNHDLSLLLFQVTWLGNHPIANIDFQSGNVRIALGARDIMPNLGASILGRNIAHKSS